jgi:hypothetical protein
MLAAALGEAVQHLPTFFEASPLHFCGAAPFFYGGEILDIPPPSVRKIQHI